VAITTMFEITVITGYCKSTKGNKDQLLKPRRRTIRADPLFLTSLSALHDLCGVVFFTLGGLLN